MFSLNNKIALIVGGTSGIGKEISLGFAEAGATVIPLSRNEDKVNITVEDINNLQQQYLRENKTIEHINYEKIYFSMNEGDYKKPLK
jgi:NAD(P)-dependent dehydrogenase (short-subunit alcohol dehydrogenase family)